MACCLQDRAGSVKNDFQLLGIKKFNFAMTKHFRKETARLLRGFARRLEPHTLQLEHGHARTDPFFDCLERLGFKPRHIVDIGANRGNWTRTALRFFPDARYTLFEPQGELLKGSDLDLDPRIQIFAMGAGPKTSTMKLSKHERDDSFSFALSEQEVAIRVESRLRFLLSLLASF